MHNSLHYLKEENFFKPNVRVFTVFTDLLYNKETELLLVDTAKGYLKVVLKSPVAV